MSRNLSALLVLSFAACVTAADPPKAKTPGGGTKYAFLVGCEQYDNNELRPLPFAAKETEEFRQVLLKTGFEEKNVKFLHDGGERRMLPEKKKIVDEFDLLLSRVSADDTVVVLLNGHGVHYKGEATGYFCPVDAKLSDKSTLLPMDGPGGVFESLKGCKAKRKLLVVNACRNDPRSDLSQAGNKIDLDPEDVEEVPEGIAALYSCKPGEKSYYYDPKDARSKGRERSLFMHHLIEAWGAGEKMTLEDVFKRVREGASADADTLFKRGQNPVIRREYRGEWVIAAAKAWPGEDVFKKGYMLEYGLGANIDHPKALEHFRKAASLGHPLAMVEVARTHRVKGESDKAISLEKAAFPQVERVAKGDGDPYAQDYLGFMHREGLGTAADPKEAVKWYLEAAKQGDADAQNEVATLYETGSGVPMNEAEALKYYQLSAGQGYPLAQWNMGNIFENGKLGVKKDVGTAIGWYRKAAVKNHLRSQYHLAELYHDGSVVTKDTKEAAKWYRMAADQNEPLAQHYLGFLYEMGDGVPQSDEIAVYWYKRAADLGHARSQAYYGWMLMDGRGKLKANDTEAVGWYTKAADQGDGYGEYLLGFMHEEGRGGFKKSEAKAVEWYKKAAEKNVAPAKDALNRLKK